MELGDTCKFCIEPVLQIQFVSTNYLFILSNLFDLSDQISCLIFQSRICFLQKSLICLRVFYSFHQTNLITFFTIQLYFRCSECFLPSLVDFIGQYITQFTLIYILLSLDSSVNHKLCLNNFMLSTVDSNVCQLATNVISKLNVCYLLYIVYFRVCYLLFTALLQCMFQMLKANLLSSVDGRAIIYFKYFTNYLLSSVDY